ncbi:MAG: hypothetical protein IJ962_04380 [Clostridia bacterium]|nr:hypothetical protein [Clostridia bacterium]MBR2417177.1 hypothetical protein [Clostridia bacterium]
MMNYIENSKRITVFAGHYGSGKTNIAINFAKALRQSGKPVMLADLDIVNPYFRSKDSEGELNEAGIDLICSEFASSNVDIPALPSAINRITNDKSTYAVLDIGGDDAGSVVLGRLSGAIKNEDNFEMIFVVNFFRPITRTAEDALEIMREIEAVSSLKFTAIVNNSNLGELTAEKDIFSTENEVKKLCKIASLPLLFTSVESNIYDVLKNSGGEYFPLKLQKKQF